MSPCKSLLGCSRGGSAQAGLMTLGAMVQMEGNAIAEDTAMDISPSRPANIMSQAWVSELAQASANLRMLGLMVCVQTPAYYGPQALGSSSIALESSKIGLQSDCKHYVGTSSRLWHFAAHRAGVQTIVKAPLSTATDQLVSKGAARKPVAPHAACLPLLAICWP